MTIWILNHYATDTYFDHGGRHYMFAKCLMRQGYSVRIFCANTVHNSDKVVSAGHDLYTEDSCDEIPFVFVKARQYEGNGKQRILNMLDFYKNVQKVATCFEKPDVIIGSSVHPLACVAAIKLGKRYNCRTIAEIRDLWPESIVALGLKEKNSPIILALYYLEKWIYTKTDALIFTMEGGRDYIIEQGWDTAHGGPVDLNKVHHINNGVDLEVFDANSRRDDFHDDDLDNPSLFKVVYTGAIRGANQVDKLVEVAQVLHDRNESHIKILIWGAGDQIELIQEMIRERGVNNITIKGLVPKSTVPQILRKSDLNIYLLADSPLLKYGLSMNKSFDYFASGKPVLSSLNSAYSIIDRYQCGVCLDTFTPESMAEAIVNFKEMPPEEYDRYCDNARAAAQAYDFKLLTKKLYEMLEQFTGTVSKI